MQTITMSAVQRMLEGRQILGRGPAVGGLVALNGRDVAMWSRTNEGHSANLVRANAAACGYTLATIVR